MRWEWINFNETGLIFMKHQKKSKVENLNTDIVVIGAGGAGLSAAMAAAENGSHAVVLEERRVAGGNSKMALGLFAAESPVQKRQKIHASKDELFKMAMDFANWKIDPRIFRAYVNKSGDTIRWLESKGLRFGDIHPLFPNQYPLTWHCPEGAGPALIDALVESCMNQGVTFSYQTKAKKLLTDKAGNITGVLAEKQIGNQKQEIKIAAGSVIIASGGFGSNKRMLKKYSNDYADGMIYRGIPIKGEGIQMAIEVGAAIDGIGTIQKSGPFFRGSLPLWRAAIDPHSIWVNKRGERFIDEVAGYNPFESVNALLRQPDRICYSLFDAKFKKRVIDEGTTSYPSMSFEQEDVKITDFEKELQVHAEKGNVKIASTWDEIAEWIGADPAALQATIDEYNRYCKYRYDEIFDKDRMYLTPLRTPPFVALKCYSAFLGTIGGIKINHHMEVLNGDDIPIPSLYAAGVDTGGWEPDTYCARLAGSTLGFAINSGRIAGENAANRVSMKLADGQQANSI
jgi:fumarate reductase flavoprotein subunit